MKERGFLSRHLDLIGAVFVGLLWTVWAYILNVVILVPEYWSQTTALWVTGIAIVLIWIGALRSN